MKKTLFALSLIINSSIILAQVPSIVPSQGLEAWWSFSGNTNDLSGNGNNFTNTGAAALTTDRDGNANSAYNFNGVDQYLIVNSPSFSFAESDSFTVSFWTQKASNQYGIAVMQSSGTSGNFIWLFQSSATGVLNFGTNKQGSAWSWANSAYSVNQWEHFLGTYANGTMKIYKNGQYVTSATFGNTGSIKAALPLRIGRSHGGNYYAGKIDDLGIWSRVLSQAEITDLYLGCNVALSSQPQNETVGVGTAVSFGIGTASTGINYQWQIDSSGTFLPLSNNATFQGVSTDTLSILSTSFAMDTYKFRCVLDDGGSCSDTSNAASLFVCGSITANPSATNVVINGSSQFVVSANDPNATFQWQTGSGGTFNNIANNSFYSGAQDDTLVILDAINLFDGKEYRCLVNSGVCIDTSLAAILTVTNNVGNAEIKLSSLEIYPNPSKGNLSFSVPSELIKSSYGFYNAQGQVVKEGKLDQKEMNFNLSHLPAGTYFLRLEGLQEQQIIQLLR